MNIRVERWRSFVFVLCLCSSYLFVKVLSLCYSLVTWSSDIGVLSDAGKSTIGGQILFLSGQVDDRTIQKYEKEAKDKARDSW